MRSTFFFVPYLDCKILTKHNVTLLISFISLFHAFFNQGVVIFHDVFDNEYNVGGAQLRIEGVYIWPFRQLRMVANRWTTIQCDSQVYMTPCCIEIPYCFETEIVFYRSFHTQQLVGWHMLKNTFIFSSHSYCSIVCRGAWILRMQ